MEDYDDKLLQKRVVELYFDLRLEYSRVTTMLDEGASRHNFEEQFVFRLMGLPQVTNVLSRVWSRLNKVEQEALYLISSGDIKSKLSARGGINAQLVNKSLVYQDIGEGNYQPFSALFANFVQEQYRVQADVKLVAEHVTRVSESLSPIDRALYQYLYQHADQVCTFDELLGAVWGDSDNKSKRALEASVHRLRRKSLSKGEEIKNIRGQGYKFVPSDLVSTNS